MAAKREKGKIPHAEWPNILAKYGKGETMAQIGREYGCTAPAIRYIIKRSGLLKGGAGDERAPKGDGPSRQHDPAAAPAMVMPSWRASHGHVLGPELRQRVSGDVASFLVALDHAVLQGSLESVANLQEATDRLMRSTARTRLELEQLLNRLETGAREKSRRKVGSPQRRA